MKPLTLWQSFAQKWQHGCGSSQCSIAHRICLARGSVPCDILIVGEAPGESEDSSGSPFVGPAGQLLDYITLHSIPAQIEEWRHIGQSIPLLPQRKTRIAYTNLVGCIPRESTGRKAGAPDDEQIEQCSQRLIEFIILCNPRMIVAVGTHAETWLDSKYAKAAKLYWKHIEIALIPPRQVPVVHILHPSFMLRQTEVRKMSMRKSAIITIAEAIEEHFELNKNIIEPQQIEQLNDYDESDIPF